MLSLYDAWARARRMSLTSDVRFRLAPVFRPDDTGQHLGNA